MPITEVGKDQRQSVRQRWWSFFCLCLTLLLGLGAAAPVAHAATAHINVGSYGGLADIRDVIRLRGSCEPGFFERLTRATWYIQVVKPNGSVSEHQIDTGVSYEWLDDAVVEHPFKTFAKPGERLRFRFHCEATMASNSAYSDDFEIMRMAATINLGDTSVPYNTTSLPVYGDVNYGAQGVALYHGNSELVRLATPAGKSTYEGTLGTSDIPIGSSWDIDVWAYASLPGGMAWEKVKTVKVTKQKVPPPPPKPTWVAPDEGTWQNPKTDISMTGKTVDYATKAEVMWQVKGATGWPINWEVDIAPDGNGQFSTTIYDSAKWKEGTYEINFGTQRGNGYYSEHAGWRTVHIDRTAPTVSWEGSPADGAIVRDILIKGKVTDAGSGPARAELQLREGDGQWQSPVSVTLGSGGAFSHDFGVRKDASYQVRLRGVDKVNNVSGWSKPRTFVLDRTAPKITIASPADHSWYNGKTLRVVGRIDDAVSGVGKIWIVWAPGVGSYYEREDVVPNAEGVLDFTLDSLGGKDLEIAVGAEDGVGNIGYAPESYSTGTGLHVKVDTKAPTVALSHGLAIGQTTWFKSTQVTVGGVGTDNESGVATGQYRWRNTALTAAPWTESAALPAGTDGAFANTMTLLEQNAAYEVQMRATDRAGNVSPWSGSAFLKVKTTAPVVAWADSDAVEPGTDRITVRGRLTDSQPTQATVKIAWGRVVDAWQYLSVTAAADGTFSHTFTNLEPGTHYEFKLLATDVAGNVAQPTERRRAWTWQAAGDVFSEFKLTPEAHQDIDGSGGFTVGDKLVYRLRVVAATDIDNFQLSLTLPGGIATELDPGHRVAINPATRINTAHGYLITHRLNQDWQGTSGDGALLVRKNGQGSPDLKKGDVVVLDIPVVLREGATGTLSAQANAWSANNPGIVGEKAGSVDIQMQADGFPVDRGLSASLQPEGLPPVLTPLGTEFTYVVTLTAHHWPMHGAHLNYVLPQGLHRNGAPGFAVNSDLQQGLNAAWRGTAAAADLLTSTATLAPGQQAIVRVPVKLDANEVGELCSEIEAGAASLRGTQWLGHRVDVELIDEDYSIHCPKPR